MTLRMWNTKADKYWSMLGHPTGVTQRYRNLKGHQLRLECTYIVRTLRGGAIISVVSERCVDINRRDVDTKGRGVDTKGRVWTLRGECGDTKGRGVDTKGRGVDTKGRGVDTRGRVWGH